MKTIISRPAALTRAALLKLGGLGLAAGATVIWRGAAVARLASAAASPAVGCLLAPEQTQGP